MKSLLSIVLITTLAITNGFSQGGFKRQFTLPLAKNNTTQAVFETTLGNYMVCGIVVDTLNNFQTNRLCLVGLNAQGQPQWVKKYGNHKFEYLDNPLIVKWFYKQGNFIYHVGCVRDSSNKYLGVLIKLNFNGDTIWQKKYYDLPNNDVIPQQVTGSADGGFLITGFSQDWVANTSPVLIIKTDANGKELWRKKLNKAVPNTQDAKVILQDSASKKIVTVGYQYIGNSNAWGHYSNLIIADSLGNILQQLNPIGTEGVLGDIIQTRDKKFVAIGNVKTSLMVGALETYKSYILKFDINNPTNPIWAKQIDIASPVNGFSSVKELSNGDLIVSGGLDTNILNNLDWNTLQRLVRIDKNGNIIWKKYYNYQSNAPAANQQGIIRLELTGDNNFIAAIQVRNTSPNPFFVVKYDSTGCDSTVAYCSTVGLNEVLSNRYAIKIFPNPTTGIINMLPSSLVTHIKIINSLGQLVYETDFIENQTLNIQSFPSGIYFLQLFNKKEIINSCKIVKE